jgi:hypothetical protein
VIISPHSNINIHYYENRGLPIPGTLYYLNFFIKSSKGNPGHKLFNVELKKWAMVVAFITTFITSNTPIVKVVDGGYPPSPLSAPSTKTLNEHASKGVYHVFIE